MSGRFNPGRYGAPGRSIPRLTSGSGVGGLTPVPDAGDTGFDNTDAGLPGSPDTIQEAIDALADLLNAGFPRPLMAFDPDLDMWFVVTSDGTAVMVTG